jgi:predicted esterase
MIGFSAGAMVTSAAMLQRDATLRPSFAALIYGAPFGKMPAIPAGLPPVFMAWAKDDQVALAPVVKFHDALVAAGQPPETHVYAKGGHGFGMKHQGTDSDRWVDDHERWLHARGVMDAAPYPRIPSSPHPRN